MLRGIGLPLRGFDQTSSIRSIWFDVSSEIMEMTRPRPPTLFRLAGHPVRWTLVRELASGDRRVRELTAALQLPQSLVSYHLGQLRAAGMVCSRRSAADGRDAYYRLDLARCDDLLAEAGGALHPGLATRRDTLAAAPRQRVLFLCTGNSARSQMAEALLERLSDQAVNADSAGSRPKPLHPSAVRVMATRGIDLSDRSSKHLDVFLGEAFDYVISLCDRVREVCPDFLGGPRTIHWSIPDPAAEAVDETNPDAAFERTADELRRGSGSYSTNSKGNVRNGGDPRMSEETVNVRYMVDDVEEAVGFYTRCSDSPAHKRRACIRRRPPRTASVASQRAEELGGTADARRAHPRARRVEPHPLHRRRHPRRGRATS